MAKRLKRSVVILDPWRNNHLNFLERDPEYLEIRETEYAGKGVFAKRTFQKNEFIVNYRGILTDKKTSDIFAFDLGKPDHLIIDAEKTVDSLGRYMNDIDPFHNKNCFPVKFSHDNVVGIKFVTNKVVRCGKEFRYDYGCRKAPWMKLSFADKKLSESGEVKELETGEGKLDSEDMNKSNVGEINQLESVNKCEVEQKSNTGESEEVQMREVGRKEEQHLKTVEVNEVEVNKFELSEVEGNGVVGNEFEVGLEASVKSANFEGHNNLESQQSDQVAVDLFDEFSLGGCEDAVDVDLIDLSRESEFGKS